MNRNYTLYAAKGLKATYESGILCQIFILVGFQEKQKKILIKHLNLLKTLGLM